MPSALVYNNSVEDFYPGNIPARIYFNHGGTVDGASVGYSNANGYSILPAAYTDTPPQTWSYSIPPNNYTVSGGTVNVTRTWITPAPPPPVSVQVNSISTPLINAPYSISLQSLKTYASLASQIQAFNTFPNGSSSMVINDANGIPHSFTTSLFLTFYNAVNYFFNAVASGQNPQSPLTIA